jgi:hypothetical protein
MGYVDLETFVLGDGRGEGVDDAGECREGARAKVTTWRDASVYIAVLGCSRVREIKMSRT